jgi:Ca2+-binding RTX toxin-like protein
VNVSAASSIRTTGNDLFATNDVDAADVATAKVISATNLAGSGSLTIFGTAENLGTMNLNGSGVGYTGALTLRPTTNAAMDFSTNTSGAGLVTGISTINLSDVSAAYASTITLAATNTTTASTPVTISFAPASSSATVLTIGNTTIAKAGSGLTDAVTLSLGANATTTGVITAPSIETFTVNSSRAAANTLTLGNITLADGAGSQTITVTSASTVAAGTFTADTVNFSGVTGAVTGLTLANTAGASFTGGSGNTTVAGSANPDVINTGIGNDTITGLAGNDIINAGDGTNSITGGAGADTLTGGSGVDTYVMLFADVGDTITNFTVATDIIDWNTALVGITATNTTPLFYQAAAAGTALDAATTVFELTGVTHLGSAANLVTALGATATNAAIDNADNLLIISYLTGGGAQIWNFIDGSGADIAEGELTLVATLVGVAADALTTANFI